MLTHILHILLLAPSLTYAWSSLGAQATALVAQTYLSNNASQQCQDLLGDGSSTYLANVATWAADYSKTPEGSHTIPFHTCAARDNAPDVCNVLFARDCPPEGCLATAVSNYTGILRNRENRRSKRANALKMLVAIVAENAQSNHNGRVNGSTIPVLWQGEASTMFKVWDDDMPTAIAGGSDLSAATRWSTRLVQAVESGDFSTQKRRWLRHMSMCWTTFSSVRWSQDANTDICTKILPNGIAAVQDKELSGDYYDNNKQLVNEQIAKGGYRLAAWLNFILTGDPQLPMPDDADVPSCKGSPPPID